MTEEEFVSLDLNEGDRVRVKIEGEFRVDSDGDVDLTEEWPGRYLTAYGTGKLGDRITIEKVAEPFKPGDVVRLVGQRRTALLGEKGYRYVGFTEADDDAFVYGETGYPLDQIKPPLWEKVTAE